MEIIKRKILLEDLTSRKDDVTYGSLTATSIYIKIILTQSGDDMGIFNNYDIIRDETFQIADAGDEYGIRYPSDTLDRYKTNAFKVSGLTEERLNDVQSYDANEIYKVGFDIDRETYTNYTGATVEGRTRVTNITADGIEYVIDANDDANIGTMNQNDGLYFKTFTARTRTVTINGEPNDTSTTEIYYNSQGWNDTNVGHSGLTKEEYLFGITTEPQVFSDVFIERGVVSPKEKHLKFSEAKTIDDLVNYGNGFFNVKK